MSTHKGIPAPERPPEASADLYLAHASEIEAAIRWVCRRHRLTGADREDFEGMARLKLLEDECRVLRRFQHRSSLQTFLVAVIQHIYLDQRNSVWGKWRPSAAARRLGDQAIELERLLWRDGLTLDQAIETLRARQGGPVDLTALQAIRDRLPERTPRRFVGEEHLATLASPAGDAESLALRDVHRDVLSAAAAALREAIQALQAQDRLLLRLHFYDGLTLAEIARLERVDQKPLYRRRERCLAELRAKLMEAGLQEAEIADVLQQENLSCD